jgi:DNA-binding response OmpR family regulator
MKLKHRILLLEDDPAEAELIAQELADDGFGFSLTRVQTEAEFFHELDNDPPDLVLADHGRPTFDGFRALEITRRLQPRLPFIFISGLNNLGTIVEMYEHGATDYVFKHDLEYLHAALRGALKLPADALLFAKPEPLPAPAQFESERLLPKALPMPPVSMPVIGHVSFCPRCRQARDEAGRVVRLEDYCGSSIEIIITRELCMDCDQSHHWS